ncbi:unnamed protein product [Tetraodon nigroviridis]|uniref:(spotted green pufferfish) hypothetical protein n=1 Tax=Tetraodon nigroviridis TaxID=99883 RepID=Q4RQE1_TETNG|nr:unnamed protein product [Tetraodon nigroviridis]
MSKHFGTTAITTATLLVWRTRLPALDSAQESGESCLTFFISPSIALPSCSVKFSSDSNGLTLGFSQRETRREVVGVTCRPMKAESGSLIRRGFVHVHGQIYLIEPLAEAETDVQGASHSWETHRDGGLHAVYNYKHLRRKRSSCSHGNQTSYYDHVPGPSGLFQLASLLLMISTLVLFRKEETLLWFQLVASKKFVIAPVFSFKYKKIGSTKMVESRVLEVANHVDKLYRPVGIRVMLVGLEIWSYRDLIDVSSDPELTLGRFLKWRQWSLLPRTKHDNAQLITIIISPLWVWPRPSHTRWVTTWVCPTTWKTASVAPKQQREAASCLRALGLSIQGSSAAGSQQQLSTFLEEITPACLLDSPSTSRIYGGPVCGNAFVEAGEECDCGTAKECRNPCCNATTCKLAAGAQCAAGECCHRCQLKATGSVCRPKSGDCDLEEYCTGFSASCPRDAFTSNGLACNRGAGYCYNGQCPSHQQHCRRLWGPEAKMAVEACYLQHGNCRKTLFNQKCSRRDQFCGKLLCSDGWEFPVTSKKFLYPLGNGKQCNEAGMNSEDNYPPDLAMVPTGTKCGPNMVRSGGRRWNKRPGSVPSLFSCVSGVLQPTVSRHEERKTVRYQRLLEQMQQPWGASSLPQDNPTRCSGRAAHGAAPDSAPRTSASRYLWSLRLLKPANLCSRAERRLRRRSPAEQLPSQAQTVCVRLLAAAHSAGTEQDSKHSQQDFPKSSKSWQRAFKQSCSGFGLGSVGSRRRLG